MPLNQLKGSAGYDLCATKEVTIVGGEGNFMVPIGVALKFPPGTYGRLAIRSGLAVRQHLAVSAGVIDEDFYPNFIQVVVFCTKNGYSYTIKKGERFAQIILEKIYQEESVAAAERTGGFGSTDHADPLTPPVHGHS